ncbi:hypothetical protein M103_2867 [Bacteroides fragilis str. 1007-1-F |nr:hypothetical protein M103_2867 [Bacteroides fragilis str. 1007-1-F \
MLVYTIFLQIMAQATLSFPIRQHIYLLIGTEFSLFHSV